MRLRSPLSSLRLVEPETTSPAPTPTRFTTRPGATTTKATTCASRATYGGSKTGYRRRVSTARDLLKTGVLSRRWRPRRRLGRGSMWSRTGMLRGRVHVSRFSTTCVHLSYYQSRTRVRLTHFQFTECTPGSFVEERDASIVWRFWTGPTDDCPDRQVLATMPSSNIFTSSKRNTTVLVKRMSI